MRRGVKADVLEIASIVAPVLRDGRRTRPIKIVDKSGAVVGERSPAEIALGVFRHAGVALEVQPDAKPTHSSCAACGTPFPVRKGAGVKGRHCQKCSMWTCSRPSCGRLVGPRAVQVARRARRKYAYCSIECANAVRAKDVPAMACARPGCVNVASRTSVLNALNEGREIAFCSRSCAVRYARAQQHEPVPK